MTNLSKALREYAEDIHTVKGRNERSTLLCEAAERIEALEEKAAELEQDLQTTSGALDHAILSQGEQS